MTSDVFFYVPNLIGYVRLGCFLIAAGISETHVIAFLTFYSIAALLDVFDGVAARKLNQVSKFGAFLDVVLDNIQRGYLWVLVFPKVGFFVTCLEWLTLFATQHHGSNWKDSSFDHLIIWPNVVKFITYNGFNSVLGRAVLISTHLLPLTLFIHSHKLLPGLETPIICLAFGRCMAAAIEISLVATYFNDLAASKE